VSKWRKKRCAAARKWLANSISAAGVKTAAAPKRKQEMRARTPATMKTSVCVASSHCDMNRECVSVGERRKMRERERGTNYQWAARVVLDAWLGGRDEKTRAHIQRAATATTMTTPPSSLKRCARRRLCRGERVARARSMRRRLATPSLRHTNPIVVGGGNKNGFANFSGGTLVYYIYMCL
jgi:hypothetical protein